MKIIYCSLTGRLTFSDTRNDEEILSMSFSMIEKEDYQKFKERVKETIERSFKKHDITDISVDNYLKQIIFELENTVPSKFFKFNIEDDDILLYSFDGVTRVNGININDKLSSMNLKEHTRKELIEKYEMTKVLLKENFTSLINTNIEEINSQNIDIDYIKKYSFLNDDFMNVIISNCNYRNISIIKQLRNYECYNYNLKLIKEHNFRPGYVSQFRELLELRFPFKELIDSILSSLNEENEHSIAYLCFFLKATLGMKSDYAFNKLFNRTYQFYVDRRIQLSKEFKKAVSESMIEEGSNFSHYELLNRFKNKYTEESFNEYDIENNIFKKEVYVLVKEKYRTNKKDNTNINNINNINKISFTHDNLNKRKIIKSLEDGREYELVGIQHYKGEIILRVKNDTGMISEMLPKRFEEFDIEL